MLFYPSHDIALGNGVRHFNPPAAARQLQDDLSWLAEIWNYGEVQPLPWGWDWDTRHYLNKSLGIKEKYLPNDQQLEALRRLSSRRTTITILNQIGFSDEIPSFLKTDDQLKHFISDHDKDNIPFALKTPWSSSGRGLIRSTVTPRGILQQRATSVIRKMGGIIGEKWYNKKKDFAMLFKVTHHEVTFVGYSLFDNEENGTYRQGYLLSNEEIERRIGNNEQLHAIREKLLPILSHLFSPFFDLPWQVGYIGIDMMLYAPDARSCTDAFLEDTPLLLHPCIEMNVRCTMGVVCRLWSDRNLKAGQEGYFRISPMSEEGHFEAQFELTK